MSIYSKAVVVLVGLVADAAADLGPREDCRKFTFQGTRINPKVKRKLSNTMVLISTIICWATSVTYYVGCYPAVECSRDTSIRNSGNRLIKIVRWKSEGNGLNYPLNLLGLKVHRKVGPSIWTTIYVRASLILLVDVLPVAWNPKKFLESESKLASTGLLLSLTYDPWMCLHITCAHMGTSARISLKLILRETLLHTFAYKVLCLRR